MLYLLTKTKRENRPAQGGLCLILILEEACLHLDDGKTRIHVHHHL